MEDERVLTVIREVIRGWQEENRPYPARMTAEEYAEANRLPEMEQWRAEQDAHRIKHIDTEIAAAHEGP